MVVGGTGIVLSGLVDLVEDGADTEILVVTGLVVAGLGAALRRLLAMPTRVPPRVALRSVVVAAVAPGRRVDHRPTWPPGPSPTRSTPCSSRPPGCPPPP